MTGPRAAATSAGAAAGRYQCGRRGRGWQRGQEYDDRFMNASRRTGAPQRRHGMPSCPYTASERSK